MIGRGLLLCLLAFAMASPSLWAATEARHRERIPLENTWSVRQLPDDGMAESQDAEPPRMEGGWLPATVPGDVHLDLLKDGKIPDPFYRDNEAKLQWIEKAGWEYRSSIDATSAVLGHEHIDLVFDGLDTACTIYLNGQRISSPDNMFREWRIDVKPLLHAGANELRIVFPAPMKAAEAVAEKDPWHSRTHTDPKGYIRKAVYEFGWDWGPRFATSGVFRPAYLEVWDEARVKDIFLEQEDVTAASAHLDVHAEILASKEAKVLVSVLYGVTGADQHADRMVTLAPGSNRISIPIEITHPQRWYPSGYGAQPIYHFHLSVKEGGYEVDSKDAKTGLRSVVLRRDLDKWGRSSSSS